MVTPAEIQALADRIAREFHPERIILFGSHSRAQARPDSDVDLLVLLPFEGTPFRKALEILEKIDPPFSVDLIARRPDDAAARYRFGDPLIREAFDHGQVLFRAAGAAA